MRVGVVVLPEHPWPVLAERWRRAEALGLDHAWTYDHLSWRSLRNGPWHAAVPVLTAAATVTDRLRLGTLVASPNYRHPVPFARELITLDDVSGGRITLGIGSGGTGFDATVLGDAPWSARERADRFEEFVTLTDLLLCRPETTWRGRYYAAHQAVSHPGCVQRPRLPLAIAAAGPRGLRLAAEHGDAWVTIGDGTRPDPAPVAEGVAVVGDQVARLEDACAALDRDPATIDRIALTGLTLDSGLGSPAQFEDTVGRYAEVGVTDLVVHWPRPTPPYHGDEAAFEAIFADRG